MLTEEIDIEEKQKVNNTSEKKLNCWEFKKCGREPGGENIETYGVCPAATATSFDGFHGGVCAGRACWAVAGTFCGGQPQGTFARKIKNCAKCDFHQLVITEEKQYKSAVSHLNKIKKAENKKKKDQTFREPGFIEHIFAKSKRTTEENLEVESMFISFLIAWTSFCPSISIIAASKRLCKDDLVDELMVIDAIADNPRRRALKLYFKTVFKAIRRNVTSYFEPLIKKSSKIVPSRKPKSKTPRNPA